MQGSLLGENAEYVVEVGMFPYVSHHIRQGEGGYRGGGTAEAEHRKLGRDERGMGVCGWFGIKKNLLENRLERGGGGLVYPTVGLGARRMDA